MTIINHFEIHDIRFPTSLTGDGSDAMNLDCDYSSAYVSLYTDSNLVGHGMTFTIGRGNDIVCQAIKQVANRIVNKEIESLFADMGRAWTTLWPTRNYDGSVPKRVLYTSRLALWTTLSGICTPGLARSRSGSSSST
ncbi:hypothetical protein BJV77DRAFT_217105 [Russula vinacea]|nr:hypothetical protein BJV77DRAFT_217105 [Russula vinacea]